MARRAHAAACEEVSDAISAAYIGDAGAYSRTLARVAVELAELPPPVGGIAMARVPEVMRRLACLRHQIFAEPLARRQIALFLSLLLLGIGLLGGLRLARVLRGHRGGPESPGDLMAGRPTPAPGAADHG